MINFLSVLSVFHCNLTKLGTVETGTNAGRYLPQLFRSCNANGGMLRSSLVTENDRVGNLHERCKASRREFARKHVGVCAIGLPEVPDELRGHLLRLVRVRVAVKGVGPVHPGERELGASCGVLHVQQRREVVLLRVARVLPLDETRQLELVPEPPVPDHHDGVPPGEHEELGADAEALVGHLREHGVVAARVIAVVQSGLGVEDLDEAAVAAARPGSVSGERAVEGREGPQRDAGLGEHREEVVGRVVEQRGGEEASRGRDERGGGALGGLPPDYAAAEGGRGREGERRSRVGVDVDVEEAVVAREEPLPERGEDEVRVGEEEKGHLLLPLSAVGSAEEARGGGGASAGLGGGRGGEEHGAAEQREVLRLVGVRDDRERAGRDEARRDEEDGWDGQHQQQQQRQHVGRRHLPCCSSALRLRSCGRTRRENGIRNPRGVRLGSGPVGSLSLRRAGRISPPHERANSGNPRTRTGSGNGKGVKQAGAATGTGGGKRGMSIGDDVRQRIRGGCRAQSRGGALGRGRRGEKWRRSREGVRWGKWKGDEGVTKDGARCLLSGHKGYRKYNIRAINHLN
jgi:hypothetical protein